MGQNSFQQQRFELKYLIKEEITLAMRDFVSGYLELDDYGVGQPTLAYPVHSVYLDNDGLQTYHDTINGNKNRFKLRLRYYDDRPDTPVFFEVKARVDKCIIKHRCGVKRSAVPLLMAGQLPDPDQLISREPKHLAAIQKFNELQHQLNARPKAHNTYMREAWVSPHDNSVRVTFDRFVRIEAFFRCAAPVEMTRPVPIFSEFTILELKFTNRFPDWFSVMVKRFNLVWAASAKYVGGVLFMGEHWFHDGEKTLDWQQRVPHEWAPDVVQPRMRGSQLDSLAVYE
jgi:hypothetical protein